MNSTRSNPKIVLLFRLFNGFLLGAGLGLASGYLIFYLALPNLGDLLPHDESGMLTLIILAQVGTPLMALLGGLAGVWAAYRLRRSQSISRWIAGTGYVLAASLGAFFAISLLHYRQGEQEFKLRVESAQAERLAEWEGAYGAKYPREEASLPALLGPLLYPGSRLVQWSTLPTRTAVDAIVWEIVTTTSDELEHVLAYFMSILPEGLDRNEGRFDRGRSWRFASAPQSSSDGLQTVVNIEELDGSFQILFRTQKDRSMFARSRRDRKEASTHSQAWPETLEVYRNRVLEHRRPKLSAFEALFGGAAYPNAHLAWGRFDYRSTYRSWNDYLAFRTEDPIERVLEHFRRHMPAAVEATIEGTGVHVFEDLGPDGVKRSAQFISLTESDQLDGVVTIYSEGW